MPEAKPPAIAYLISQYPAVNHTFILREARQLRSMGFDIRAVSIRPPDRPRDRLAAEEQEEAARTFYVKRVGVFGALGAHLRAISTRPLKYVRGIFYALTKARWEPRKSVYHLGYFSQAVVVGNWMRRQRVRHVHTHFSSTVALFLAKMYPVSFSATIHGPDEFNDAAGFLLPEKVAASRFICAISQYGRSQLARVSSPEDWDKIVVAPLGVDVTVFGPRMERPTPDRFEILCVGRLAPAKAQRILLGAISRLASEGRKVRLRLIGDGPDRAFLGETVSQLRLRDHVGFEGSLNQDRVREIYGETDVSALASFAEGVPVVLMEAMAMEIPCVATWITGVPELIRNEVDGLLVPPGDEGALACAIARLQDDSDLRNRIGKAGRRRVIEKYDLATNVAKLAEIFRDRLQGL